MSSMTPEAKKFWKKYLATLPEEERPKDPFLSVGIAGNEEIADKLLALYLEGKKWAGSGLRADFETVGDPLPKPGNFWMILDSKGAPRCLVRTRRVEQYVFRDIPEELARAEGEGDLSVAYWKKAHREFFTPYLKGWGVKDLDSAVVVAEYFEILLKGKAIP